ncbi:MAG: hypothetical protein QOH06_280 [Acidobacteriota bacterium]|jgi:hypothetical protein|nr:hypothetical protein [Acidobacteriota bacterium]
MTDNWMARAWRSSGLVALAVVFYALCGMLSVSFTRQLSFSDSPGLEPPWYFIRQDAINGLCMLLYLVLCLAIGTLAIRKRWPGGAGMVLFGIIWSSASVWQLALIYLKSDDIFDPVAARTSWPTFDSYIEDPLRWGWLLLFLFAIPYIGQIRDWQKNPAPAPPSA